MASSGGDMDEGDGNGEVNKITETLDSENGGVSNSNEGIFLCYWWLVY